MGKNRLEHQQRVIFEQNWFYKTEKKWKQLLKTLPNCDDFDKMNYEMVGNIKWTFANFLPNSIFVETNFWLE